MLCFKADSQDKVKKGVRRDKGFVSHTYIQNRFISITIQSPGLYITPQSFPPPFLPRPIIPPPFPLNFQGPTGWMKGGGGG